MATIPKKIDDLLQYKFKTYLKVYLVLKHKNFSWQKELQNDFNIENSVVKESLKLLEKESFVISKNFFDLEFDFQEIIRRSNASYLEKINTYPKIYILNEDEIRTEWWECNKERINLLIKDDGSFEHTLNLANKKKKSQTKLQNMLEEENNTKTFIVRKDYKQGIIFETKSKLSKIQEIFLEKAKQELKKIKLENKKQLTNKEKKQLQIIKQKGTNLIAKQNLLNNLMIKNLTINNNKVSDIEYNEKLAELKKYEKKSLKYEKEINEDLKKQELNLKQYSKQSDEYYKQKQKYEKQTNKLIQQLNKSKITEYEFNKNMNNLNLNFEKHLQNIKNQPQIEGIGKSINEIDEQTNKRLTNLFEDLGIIEKSKKKSIQKTNQSKYNNSNSNQKKFKQLEKELIKFGFLDIYKTINYLGGEKQFIEFQNTLTKLNITIEDDDLVLIKK